MTDAEIWEIAMKRAGFVLASLMDAQLNTWSKQPTDDSPRWIIARQICEAMNDVLKGKTP
jgi:hypothetical protein